MGSIEVVHGDITKLDVDAIVNAANSALSGGGGVDGAIHRAAGPQLLAACRKLGRCQTGDARTTPGFALPARFVIHAVGPVWDGGDHDEDALLEHAYASAFAEAEKHGVRTIAFPCISTGVYGFPKDRGAQIAVRVMEREKGAYERIVACTFGRDDEARYRTLLRL